MIQLFWRRSWKRLSINFDWRVIRIHNSFLSGRVFQEVSSSLSVELAFDKTRLQNFFHEPSLNKKHKIQESTTRIDMQENKYGDRWRTMKAAVLAWHARIASRFLFLFLSFDGHKIPPLTFIVGRFGNWHQGTAMPAFGGEAWDFSFMCIQRKVKA